MVAFLGHAGGVKAPGIRDWPTALRVAHILLLSHWLAVPALRETAPVGITLNLAPARSDDTDAARRMDGYMNRWFLDPLLRGAYPADMVEHYERRFGPLDLRIRAWRRSTSSASTTTRRSGCAPTRRASRSS